MSRSSQSQRTPSGRVAGERGTLAGDDVVELSPAIVATSIGAAPMPLDDSRLPDQDGTTAPSLLREEQRAGELARATEEQVIADHFADGWLQTGRSGFLDDRVDADAAAATWESHAAVRERVQCEADLIDAQIGALEQHTDCTITPKRQIISIVGKPLMVAGDTSIFASILYLGGSPLTLAILAGVSTATSLVATGSTWGKAEKFAEDRVRRGPLPTASPRQLGTLFERGSAATVGRNVWRALAASVALAVFVAFTVLGRAVGDPGGKALAIGLLAAITVAGSAALEAYGANEAADLLHQLVARRRDVTARLDALLAPASRRAAAAQRAHTLQVAIEHSARAAGTTAFAIADRSPETPVIAGYLARGGQELPTPRPPAALGGLATITSDRPSAAASDALSVLGVIPVSGPVAAPFAAPTVPWPASAPSITNGTPTSVSSS